MRIGRFTTGILAAMLVAGAAQAAPAPPREIGKEARIPFADRHGIRDFQAESDNALWIEDQSRNWYYAELLGPCTGLTFATAIGFETRGTSTLDKFGQILVEGRRCPIRSFVTAAPPPKKADRKKKKG